MSGPGFRSDPNTCESCISLLSGPMDDELIERIYDAALSGSLWPEILAEITARFEGVGTVLIASGANGHQMMFSPGFDIVMQGFVEEGWSKQNRRFERATARRLAGFMTEQDLFTGDELLADPMLEGFLLPRGIGSELGTVIAAPSGDVIALTVQRRFQNGKTSATMVAEANALRPHIARAILFANRAALTGPSSDLVSGLMATLSCGIACLNVAGRVLLANPALERFALDGLSMVNARLKTANKADQPALDALIRRALVPGLPAGHVLAPVSRPSGRRALLVGALPLSAGRQARFLDSAFRCRALVTVIDPDAAIPERIEPALRSLELSPAEARLAALVGGGLSPREAAERLVLTEGTARTRLKQIFEKVGLSRQSELARLVTQLALINGR